MLSTPVDGSIAPSKTPRDPAPTPKQVALHRAFVRSAFAPT